MKSKSLTQDVAIKNPTSLVGPHIHQDSKAAAMILKATSLIVATITKLTDSFHSVNEYVSLFIVATIKDVSFNIMAVAFESW